MCAAGIGRYRAGVATYGMTLSSEEHPPRRLLHIARLAEESGFEFLSISDHFHPWLDEQGHSPFVWSVLGALAETTSLDVVTGVTCPTVRVHPAILAQATATTAALFEGRFSWGVGSGEALNEHILGDRWPPAPVRLEMLEEAIGLVRELWKGESVTHYGEHYTDENARIYDDAEHPPAIPVSAFGPLAADVAARAGDGLIVTGPSKEIIDRWRQAGGSGPVYGQVTLGWAESRDDAVETAHRIWRTSGVPGQLSQDLPTPTHFDQAASIVTPAMIAESELVGPDPEPVAERVGEMVAAGVDHIYFHQIGPDQEGFAAFWTDSLEAALT